MTQGHILSPFSPIIIYPYGKKVERREEAPFSLKNSQSILHYHTSKSSTVLCFKSIKEYFVYRSVSNPHGHVHKILSTLSKKPPVIQTPSLDTSKNIKEKLTAEEALEEKPKVDTFLNKKIVPSEQFRNTRKPPQPVYTQENPHVIFNKESIYHQLSLYDNLKIEDANNLEIILLFLKQISMNYPGHAFARQGQVVQELLYARCSFTESLLKEHFKSFELIDLIGKNNGIADITTLYNLNAGEFLFNNFDAIKKIDLRVIISTYKSYDKIPQTTSDDATINTLKIMKEKTGNSISDLYLNEIPFDYKPEVAINKNFISFMLYDNFFNNNSVHRYHMSLKNYLEHLNSKTEFQQNYYDLVNNLLKEKSMNSYDRQQIINEFILNNISKMVYIQDRASLLIPLTHEEFTPDNTMTEKVNRMHLFTNKSYINELETKKVLINEVTTWEIRKQEALKAATHNILALNKDPDNHDNTL